MKIIKWLESIKQLLKFGIVGLAATGLHLLLALVLLYFGVNVYLANSGAFLGAFVLSYIGHNYWTFSMSSWHPGTLLKSFLLASIGFLTNNILLTFLLKIAMFNEGMALFFSLLLVPLLSYFGSRIWVFKKNKLL
ncbi:MAG: hypothetical protein RL571_1523 [Pseudomonadota bacterium]|jgi:putative flippase GtrA|uniref:GtrA family protein n=1 Tax=Iodobacter ciconiae TaxID=2496266 RepID=A0A3S8ZWG6_9NEIS|nr:GtrA family protein [Iodobacter ciconiae]AZN37822.1 GtrA family protein [Iodobacter ciconiae]